MNNPTKPVILSLKVKPPSHLEDSHQDAQNADEKGLYQPRRPEGHEVILASFIKKKRPIKLIKIDGGEVFGFVTQFDSETITVKATLNGAPKTYFKHALESFEYSEEAV